MNLLPYMQAAAAGTYLVAFGAIALGRWRPPVLTHPWFVIGLFVAFAAERGFPQWANVTDPATFAFAALAGFQIARAGGGEHRSLWRALAFVPLLVMLLIASSSRFPEIDAEVMRATESALLAAPAAIALLYAGFTWMVRSLT